MLFLFRKVGGNDSEWERRLHQLNLAMRLFCSCTDIKSRIERSSELKAAILSFWFVLSAALSESCAQRDSAASTTETQPATAAATNAIVAS